MNRNEQIIKGVSEAISFVREMWVCERFPVWTGNVQDFIANVVTNEVTSFDVFRILTAISNGDHIEEMQGVFVIKDYKGSISKIEIRKKS